MLGSRLKTLPGVGKAEAETHSGRSRQKASSHLTTTSPLRADFPDSPPLAHRDDLVTTSATAGDLLVFSQAEQSASQAPTTHRPVSARPW